MADVCEWCRTVAARAQAESDRVTMGCGGVLNGCEQGRTEKNSRMAPRAGFEPATIRLTVECSTAELPRNKTKPEGVRTRQRITKPSGLAKEEMGGCDLASIDQRNHLCRSDLLAFWARPESWPGHPPCDSAVGPFDRFDAKSTHLPPTLDRAGLCQR
jgi:hypothetical protein